MFLATLCDLVHKYAWIDDQYVRRWNLAAIQQFFINRCPTDPGCRQTPTSERLHTSKAKRADLPSCKDCYNKFCLLKFFQSNMLS